MPVDEQHPTGAIHSTPHPAHPVRPLQDQSSSEDEPDHSSGRPDLTWALTSARDGDQNAFKVLYDDLNPRILHYLRTLVRTDAEDIASETWLQIGRDLAGFHGSWHKWRSWAITIARNRALDHLRRQQRRRHTHIPIEELEERVSGHDTENEALDRLSWQTTLLLISSLPHSEAQAVVLRSLIGLTATEASHILGKEPGAVRTAAHRGLRKLTHHATQLGLKP